MIAECHNHNLNQRQKIRAVWLPIVQIRQVDLAIVIHIHGHLNLHRRRWFHKTHWSILGMGVHQPYTNGNVVGII